VEKRYQVFLSSTYADLQQERQKVIQTLMELDCIPAGMELFPAADEEQWEFIKRVIDDCDYYIVIIGGRYGSLTQDGISYTEKEYDYAISKGIKVLGFIHNRPEDIPVGKSDIQARLRKKLEEFREKVSTGRLVKFWTNAAELPGLVALSLSKTIKLYPAVGWTRARVVTDQDLLIDLNELRKENELLRNRVLELTPEQSSNKATLAGLDEHYDVRLLWKVHDKYGSHSKELSVNLTWARIFASIGVELFDRPNDALANSRMAEALYREKKPNEEPPTGIRVDHDQFQTIRLQLTTLGLIAVDYIKTIKGGMALFWSLTAVGQEIITELRAVKSSKQTDSPEPP
jgi:hypothetical protein